MHYRSEKNVAKGRAKRGGKVGEIDIHYKLQNH